MTSHVPVGFAALGLRWTMAVHQAGDAFVSTQLLRDGCWEPFESLVVSRLLCAALVGDGSTPLFVDCGANIGWYSLLAAHLGVDVLAVEPMPENAALLAHNVRVNAVEHRVRVERCALGDRRGVAELHLSATNQGDHRLHAGESWDGSRRRSTVAVEVRTLDDLLAELLEGRRPRVIKLDTQGSESAILHGGLRSWAPMADAPDVAIVTEFWPYGLERCGSSAEQFLEMVVPLVEHGHRCFEVVEPSRRLVALTVDELVSLPRAPGLSSSIRGFTNLAFVPSDLADALAGLLAS